MSDKELESIQEQIEERLRVVRPEVELLALERPASERLRLVIDRAEGVDLDLCEDVAVCRVDASDHQAGAGVAESGAQDGIAVGGVVHLPGG